MTDVELMRDLVKIQLQRLEIDEKRLAMEEKQTESLKKIADYFENEGSRPL